MIFTIIVILMGIILVGYTVVNICLFIKDKKASKLEGRQTNPAYKAGMVKGLTIIGAIVLICALLYLLAAAVMSGM